MGRVDLLQLSRWQRDFGNFCASTSAADRSRFRAAGYCEKIGLQIQRLEQIGDTTQDLVLTVHHAYMHTMSYSKTVLKILENHNGVGMMHHLVAPDDRLKK